MEVGLRFGAIVPQFYFNVRDGDRLIEDPDGAVLPDLAAARAAVAAALRHAAAVPHGRAEAVGARRFEIADKRGRLLATIGFRDVFRLH